MNCTKAHYRNLHVIHSSIMIDWRFQKLKKIPVCKAELDTGMLRMYGHQVGVGQIGRLRLMYVHSFIKKINLFQLEINYFTILWWFLPYIDMNQPQLYICPPSWTPLPLPSPPHPLGYPSAPALSALLHALNLDWWSISHMAIYIFQCYSLKSSHPRLLPQS